MGTVADSCWWCGCSSIRGSNLNWFALIGCVPPDQVMNVVSAARDGSDMNVEGMASNKRHARDIHSHFPTRVWAPVTGLM